MLHRSTTYVNFPEDVNSDNNNNMGRNTIKKELDTLSAEFKKK